MTRVWDKRDKRKLRKGLLCDVPRTEHCDATGHRNLCKCSTREGLHMRGPDTGAGFNQGALIQVGGGPNPILKEMSPLWSLQSNKHLNAKHLPAQPLGGVVGVSHLQCHTAKKLMKAWISFVQWTKWESGGCHSSWMIPVSDLFPFRSRPGQVWLRMPWYLSCVWSPVT